MRQKLSDIETTRINGAQVDLPLVLNFGFNDWQQAVSLSWHCHPAFEMILLLEGSANYDFEDSAMSISGGQFFVSLPRQLHRGSHDISSPAKMFWIMFDPLGEDSSKNTIFTRRDLEAFERLFRQNKKGIFTFSSDMRFLLGVFRNEIFKESYNHSSAGAIRLRSLICQILTEAYSNIITQPKQHSYDYVNAMKNRMDNDYADDVDMDTLCAELGLSRCHLYTLFRKQTGHTPNDYLLRVRVRNAQKMLSDTGLSIADIAEQTGFNSSQNFCKVFRKYTGMPPSGFRQRTGTNPAP